jgi:N-acetylglucosaminyldiphosphoundecaprenol N-acetyl-beta-D-mannosaminyltransferase
MTSIPGTQATAWGVRPLPLPYKLLGVNVTPLTSYEQALEAIGGIIAGGPKSFWAAINPQKMYRAWREPSVLEVLGKTQAGICDGIGVSLAARILSGTRLRRITGCDLFNRLVPCAAQRGWSIFLLGASPQANRLAAERLQQQYPALKIAGRCDGYFKDDEQAVRQINQARPDLLFVAMGSPRQEFWIAQHMGRIDARFFMGVGGSLDVAAGLSRRAPRVMRALGLEFFYQLITQPKRWRRQIVYVPFILRVLSHKIRGRPLEQVPQGRRGRRTYAAAVPPPEAAR